MLSDRGDTVNTEVDESKNMQQTQFDAHPVWESIAGAAATIDEIDKTKDLEAIRTIDDLRELLAVSRETQSWSAALTTETMLSRLQSAWTQIQSNLANYQANPQPQYLVNAVAQGDATREALSALPRPIAHGTAQASVTRSLNAYRTELDKSRDELEKRLNRALADAAAREDALTAEIADLTAQVAANAARLAELDAQITQTESQLAATTTVQGETFTAAQTTRDKEFKTWLKSQESSFESLATPHFESLVDAASRGQEFLDEITALRTSTVEMADLAAGDILADQYGKYAASERRTALAAYIIGGVFAAAGIVVIGWLFGAIGASLTWQQVALKLGLTLGASGVAAVAFRTAGLAIRRATSFKRQELELRALQPFLKDVDGSAAAKVAFLERAFGHAWAEPASKKGGDADVNSDLVKLMTTVIQSIPKSTAP